MKTRGQEGFTLVELIMVITILGILSIAAIPKFVDISKDAGEKANAMVIGAIKDGVQLYAAKNYIDNQKYAGPSSLGFAALGQNCEQAPGCFVNVLQSPVKQDNWRFVGSGGSSGSNYEQWAYYPDPSGYPLWSISYMYTQGMASFEFLSENNKPN